MCICTETGMSSSWRTWTLCNDCTRCCQNYNFYSSTNDANFINMRSFPFRYLEIIIISYSEFIWRIMKIHLPFPSSPETEIVYVINTLRPRHNGRHFADDIFKCIFLNENVWIPIKISLKFVPKGPINYIPSLVHIMDWRRPGDKPLSETMMVRLLTHICVIRPQWVKNLCGRQWLLHYALYTTGAIDDVGTLGANPSAAFFITPVLTEYSGIITIRNIWGVIIIKSFPGVNESTRWGRVPHIRVSKLTIMGSYNGLSHGHPPPPTPTPTPIPNPTPLPQPQPPTPNSQHSSVKCRLQNGGHSRSFCLGLNELT